MNQQYLPFIPPTNNIEQILLRIEQELIKINKKIEKNSNSANYLQKDDDLYIL